jgi:ABC-type Na+ efflux pump permease subunit
MSRAIGLIAGREFRTYVATTSFWIALALGPLILGGALTLGAGLRQAPPSASLTLTSRHGGAEAVFSENFPLSDAGRREVAGIIAREAGMTRPIAISEPAPMKLRATGLTRFTLVLLLWLPLVGSLGMLLQAVVRERANRALETLLAAAPAHEIVLGKLAGVGAVSALVVGAWLAPAAALGAIAPGAAGVGSVVLRGLADPMMLARAAALYVLGFAFYGLATIAIGATARDNAGAQNLARPLFAILLAAFFASMAMVQGGGPAWLAYVPPFTPFALLMSPQPAPVEGVAFGLLIGAAVAAGHWATWALRAEPVTVSSLLRLRPQERRSTIARKLV